MIYNFRLDSIFDHANAAYQQSPDGAADTRTHTAALLAIAERIEALTDTIREIAEEKNELPLR